MGETFRIYFTLDGKDYATREWPAVPHVGEHVMFHLKDGPFVAKVTRVVWGVDKDHKDRIPSVNCTIDRDASPEGEANG
ncbi:hypothetical protein ACHMW7_15970 [Aminobacter sp. UC22_36]|uniref:hypothetical protein n=1 Tax=Aminobacter sp. UC22_36 TaxID=3374549 RepID=UPI003756D5A3